MRTYDKKYAVDLNFGSDSNFKFIVCNSKSNHLPKFFSEQEITDFIRKGYILKSHKIIEVEIIRK